MIERTPVVVIGAGQAGLSVSYYLTERRIKHVVLEQARIADAWRTKRWDNFCLVTPNWQCQLPGFPYRGDDPDGFMLKDEIVAYVEAFAASFGAPVREGVSVQKVSRARDGYLLETTTGRILAGQVVVAVGAYHHPSVPQGAGEIPSDILQLHSSDYKNPDALPAGEVLVGGSGQSGCQIAEDLHLAGRKVHLCLGDAPRSPRKYRGKDVVAWLDELAYYDTPIDVHPDVDMVRNKTNHYLTGRDGGREIDLREFAREGMQLYGFLEGIAGATLTFAPDVQARLDSADATYNGIRALIDKHIADRGIQAPEEPPYVPPWQPPTSPTSLDLERAGITSIIWCLGFRHDFSFVDVPVFDARGYPRYQRGVTESLGLYFIGLPWLYTWGSGRFGGVARDAQYLCDQIAVVLARRQHAPSRA